MFEHIPELTEAERKQLERNKRYWGDRASKAQTVLTARNIKEVEKQLEKYYQRTMYDVLREFEFTYNKILLAVEDGKEPTPADLYKLDTYWQMQGQITKELQKLGDKQIEALSNQFMAHWQSVYNALALTDDTFFNEIDNQVAQQMINQIWCADGVSWSERVWENTKRLQEELNEGLITCLVGGKSTKELKQTLQARFNVSFNRADSLVRTEMAHIQTQAARQRYLDYGVQEVEILADKDERRCEICGKLHKQRFPIGAQVPIPAHPRCRCCIVPVID